MKKFLHEYKAFRSKLDPEKSKNGSTPEPEEEMGVFKWLKRERVTVTTQHLSPVQSSEDRLSLTNGGTIRTEEYKRDLAEFQARRSTGDASDANYNRNLRDFEARKSAQEYKKSLAEFQARRFQQKEDDYNPDLAEFELRRSNGNDSHVLPDTPVKKRCGRHSLPASCTDCTWDKDPDNTFNYEKKSASKYKKKAQNQSETSGDMTPTGNIQFLFQNQVFMPGNLFPYSEPQMSKRRRKLYRSPDPEVQRHLDYPKLQQTSYSEHTLWYDSEDFPNVTLCDETNGGTKKDYGSGSSSDCVRRDSPAEKLWEVMNELNHLDQWADDQLKQNGGDCESEASFRGLYVASDTDLNVATFGSQTWNHGAWGGVPVQAKKMTNISMEQVKKGLCPEIEVLRKCRHPNIILLMGLYQDIMYSSVHIICEECIDSLYTILHVQGRILSAQTSVHYALDIANALAFLRMHGYIHTGVTSHAIMINPNDAAKLVDLAPCVKLMTNKTAPPKQYSLEPQYVNIDDPRFSTPFSDTCKTSTIESEPLLSRHSSETYLTNNAVTKEYKLLRDSEYYRWQAPELFVPDEMDMVYPCAKSEVYSLCLVLWECCNAAVPWKVLTYEKLRDLYTIWKTGIRLPQDGTYPGSLLDLLQRGLKLERTERVELNELHNTLKYVKRNLDNHEYIVIPNVLRQNNSTFSITEFETADESMFLQSLAKQYSPHKVSVHIDTSSTSEKDTKIDSSPMCQSPNQQISPALFSQDEIDDLICVSPDKYCSTPLSVVKTKIKALKSPLSVPQIQSASLSPVSIDTSLNISNNKKAESIDTSLKISNNKNDSEERPTARLSRSFTPKSYKPLHIELPQCNFESVKAILKDQGGSEKGSYKFDIKNYSVPATPIARSNKMRKNAWLSGDLVRKSNDRLNASWSPKIDDIKTLSVPQTPATSNRFFDKQDSEENRNSKLVLETQDSESNDLNRDYTRTGRTDSLTYHSPETDDGTITNNNCSFKSSTESYKHTDDVLAEVYVKPLVALHEKRISEANKRSGPNICTPMHNSFRARRIQTPAMKPASHFVDTGHRSSHHHSHSPSRSSYRSLPAKPIGNLKNGLTVYILTGINLEQLCQARDAVAKILKVSPKEEKERALSNTKGTSTSALKMDRATDTQNIDDYIADLIKKEVEHKLHKMPSEDGSPCKSPKNEDVLNQSVVNVVENLKQGGENRESPKKDFTRSLSRIRINANNKPLLQVNFDRAGENRLEVLDEFVNVRNSPDSKDAINNVSVEDTPTDDVPLKRCQGFNAIQEAQSTEDFYIDDDIITQMQQNFGNVKVVRLQGSLHEILCDKKDECCLVKVIQENNGDSVYLCDNAGDTVDADSSVTSHETVLYKRSVSVVEERIQRIFPKDSPQPKPVLEIIDETVKIQPKSEQHMPTISANTRVISNSSPSLFAQNKAVDTFDAVEVNLENMCYQDSSSEECLRCQMENHEDFELLEKWIEEDVAEDNMNNSLSRPSTSCRLSKISEENLSWTNDEATTGDTWASRETI